MYKNALKEDLIRVVEDLDGTVESTDTIAKLKTKIEKSSTYESESSLGVVSFSNVIENSSYDLSHVKNFNIRNDLSSLIKNYKPNKIKSTKLKMNIILKDDIPVCQRARRLSCSEKLQVDDQIDDWLQQGIIKESVSDYCSSIVLCKKKDGNLRICIDYRKINSKTEKDRYPLPLIEEVLDQLQSGNFFLTIDLKNGFFHVEMEENSKKFTSFVTHSGQDLLKEGIVIIYMDDIIIPSSDELDGLNRLTRVLKTASEYGLELNLKKCNFLKSKIEFLGHIIEKGTIKPSLDKTKAVQNFPEPKTDLLRDNAVFHFGPEQQLAFQTLRQKLSENPVLHIFKQGAKLELHTDASKFGYDSPLVSMERKKGIRTAADSGQSGWPVVASRKSNRQQTTLSSRAGAAK
ncbi:retrovirus-related Pol polyprotein from transposon 17.6 [Trichonephila clavipes]|nr:retrovirus-related Pol polyprotein from transposon 17.6 [Trichonephila clavipes]